VTDATVIDAPGADPGPTVDWSSGVIAGTVVRQLVDRNEREIDELLRELEAALAEADAAERLVAGHPAATLLGLEFGAFAPEGVDTRPPATFTASAPATGGAATSAAATSGSATSDPGTVTRRPTSATRPRTTVVVRPRSSGPPTAASGGPATAPGIVLADTGATAGWVQRFQTHWMAKVGVAVTLVAVLLLKFG
jgi:hypothetical protein